MSEQQPALGRLVRLLGFGLIVCATAGTTYALAGGSHRADAGPDNAQATRTALPAPSAAEFAADLVGVANRYAAAQGDPVRLSGADCVQASTGHYMCAYSTKRPGGAKQCHIIQARWTPRQTSTFTVTLSG